MSEPLPIRGRTPEERDAYFAATITALRSDLATQTSRAEAAEEHDRRNVKALQAFYHRTHRWPAPEVGATASCVLCGEMRPWALWIETAGVPVCGECHRGRLRALAAEADAASLREKYDALVKAAREALVALAGVHAGLGEHKGSAHASDDCDSWCPIRETIRTIEAALLQPPAKGETPADAGKCDYCGGTGAVEPSDAPCPKCKPSCSGGPGAARGGEGD